MIPQEYIQEVVRRNDIEDIVGQYVQAPPRAHPHRAFACSITKTPSSWFT